MPEVPPKTCFVVSPIGDAGSEIRNHADWLYHEIIEHVLEQHFPEAFTVTRADKIHDPGMIDAQIIGHLLDDDLVIADMSMLNANAFYEMGIRHMKEKPVIHMFKKGENIPFDVKLYRAIPFNFGSPEDLKSARSDLKQAIAAILSPDYKPDNPVIRARGVQQLQEAATPAMSLFIQQMETMDSRLRNIEAIAGMPPVPVASVPAGSLRDYIFHLSIVDGQDAERARKRVSELAMQYLTARSVHLMTNGRFILTAPVVSGARLKDFLQAAGELPYVSSLTLESQSP